MTKRLASTVAFYGEDGELVVLPSGTEVTPEQAKFIVNAAAYVTPEPEANSGRGRANSGN